MDVEKEPSMLEEVAYRDMWQDGIGSYLRMLHDRIVLLKDLLRSNGTIYVHLDATVGHYVKILMDQVLGTQSFQREVIWRIGWISGYKSSAKNWVRNHDTILFYVKTPNDFTFNKEYVPYPDGYKRRKGTETKSNGYPMEDVWNANSFEFELKATESLDSIQIKSFSQEKTGYPTQKNESLLSRIIKASSNEGDLVLDCFVGSGTTAAVAEKLGRRWIGVDIGRFAIQTTRKRLLDIPGCRPFEVQNLGKYERKYWQVARTSGGVDSRLRGNDGGEDSDAVEGYVRFILDLYKSQPMLGQFSYLHGIREGRAVHVGATDSPVSSAELQATVAECASNGFSALDVLGWEWEMGLNPALKDELSRTFGVDIRLLYIPREILDQRNIDAGDVNFFELSVANVDVSSPYPGAVQVELTGFIPAVDEYMQARLTDMPTEWSDWIDYWSVDFEYDGEVFVNQWQSYRTRRERDLSLVSDPHEYEHGGLKRIVVKVIDIFGNDATVGLDFDAGN